MLTMSTVGELLRPTKGERSYPQIALRANEWIRQQVEAGTYPVAVRMSPEHVRRIFEDHTQKPNPIYLDALAVIQEVDRFDLYEAAGLSVPMSGPGEKQVLHAYRGIQSPERRKQVEEYLQRILEEDKRKRERGS